MIKVKKGKPSKNISKKKHKYLPRKSIRTSKKVIRRIGQRKTKRYKLFHKKVRQCGGTKTKEDIFDSNLVGLGSYGCVLRPSMKCESEPKDITGVISKATDYKAALEELNSYTLIQEIETTHEPKEHESKEHESKEQESKEQESKEHESKEQESKEQESKEQESKEQESKEQESKEDESKEHEAKAKADYVKSIQNLYLGQPKMCKADSNDKYNNFAVKLCSRKGTKTNKYSTLLGSEELYLLQMKDGGKNIKTYSDELNAEIEKLRTPEEVTTVIGKLRNLLFSMKKILGGIKIFMENEIIHHDLKAENIVYNEALQESYFIDFGLTITYDVFKKNADIIDKQQSATVPRVDGDNEEIGEYSHWSYPLETFFYRKHVLKSYFTELSTYDIDDFVTLSLGRIQNETEKQKLITKLEEKLYIPEYSKSKIKDLIKAIRGFRTYLSHEDKEWFDEEYIGVYSTKYRVIKLHTEAKSQHAIKDKIKEIHDKLTKSSLETFDIYGVSYIFWILLSVATQLREKVKSDKIEITNVSDSNDVDVLPDLRGIAREMSHPDYTQRITIDKLIERYDRFLISIGFSDKFRSELRRR
jgi:serine/threonine protein kinase